MSGMYTRKTSWKQDYIKNRYDPRSNHNPQKSKLSERQQSWGAWGVWRGEGGGALSPSAVVLGGRAP